MSFFVFSVTVVVKLGWILYKCSLHSIAFSHILHHMTDLENRLLARFDTASQKQDLNIMAECSKILSQVRQCVLCKRLLLGCLLKS
jgi:hypothetical protein